jgi:hypothetical protein
LESKRLKEQEVVTNQVSVASWGMNEWMDEKVEEFWSLLRITTGKKIISGSVADPDPEPIRNFWPDQDQIRNRINVSDPDSNTDQKLDPKKMYKKEH